MKTENKYPEELTHGELTGTRWDVCELFGTDTMNSFDKDLRIAVKYAKKNGCQVYTEVDGDDGSYMYLRGCHLVNRTGVFAAVRLSDGVPIRDSGQGRACTC